MQLGELGRGTGGRKTQEGRESQKQGNMEQEGLPRTCSLPSSAHSPPILSLSHIPRKFPHSSQTHRALCVFRTFVPLLPKVPPLCPVHAPHLGYKICPQPLNLKHSSLSHFIPNSHQNV